MSNLNLLTMKKRNLLISIATAFISLSNAQNDIDALLTAGVDNASRFANDFLEPGANGLMHSINANWFNSGKTKDLGAFEISIIGNAAQAKEDQQKFTMNIADYNSNPDQDFTVEFADASSSKMVATVLGVNNPEEVKVILRYDDGLGERTQEVVLPNGIGESDINLIPTAFLQGALGLGAGIELKARFVPKIETDEVKVNLYGAGLQFEMTKWLPVDFAMPVAISGLVAYNHLDGMYNLSESSNIDGENQRLETDINTWLFQLIASTKLPIINFYAGLGYIKGKSESDLLGTYVVNGGPLSLLTLEERTVEDPFSISSDVSVVRGTVGAKLKLGFFRLNAEYHLSDFNTFSVGINFGAR